MLKTSQLVPSAAGKPQQRVQNMMSMSASAQPSMNSVSPSLQTTIPPLQTTQYVSQPPKKSYMGLIIMIITLIGAIAVVGLIYYTINKSEQTTIPCEVGKQRFNNDTECRYCPKGQTKNEELGICCDDNLDAVAGFTTEGGLQQPTSCQVKCIAPNTSRCGYDCYDPRQQACVNNAVYNLSQVCDNGTVCKDSNQTCNESNQCITCYKKCGSTNCCKDDEFCVGVDNICCKTNQICYSTTGTEQCFDDKRCFTNSDGKCICCPVGQVPQDGKCVLKCGTTFCNPDSELCYEDTTNNTSTCISATGCSFNSFEYDPQSIEKNPVCFSEASITEKNRKYYAYIDDKVPLHSKSGFVNFADPSKCLPGNCVPKMNEVGQQLVSSSNIGCTSSIDCSKQLPKLSLNTPRDQCLLKNKQSCCVDKSNYLTGQVCPNGQTCVGNQCICLVETDINCIKESDLDTLNNLVCSGNGIYKSQNPLKCNCAAGWDPNSLCDVLMTAQKYADIKKKLCNGCNWYGEYSQNNRRDFVFYPIPGIQIALDNSDQPIQTISASYIGLDNKIVVNTGFMLPDPGAFGRDYSGKITVYGPVGSAPNGGRSRSTANYKIYNYNHGLEITFDDYNNQFTYVFIPATESLVSGSGWQSNTVYFGPPTTIIK